MGKSLFPVWVDRVRPCVAVLAAMVPAYVLAVVYYGASPTTINVGYQPEQPLPFSHAQHAGDLGIDCRYCHNTVERAADAAVPPTATCMNCHTAIALKSDQLLLVRQSAADRDPIHWIRVHDLPEFVYFDHSAHVSRGVGCYSCHGRIDTMETVRQVHKLSMGWCLDCHRNPEQHLRPQESITDMDWQPHKDRVVLGTELREKNNINPSTDCSTCHR